jgi:hypothetical protein
MKSQKQMLAAVAVSLVLPMSLITLAPGTAQAQVGSDTTARADTSVTPKPAGDSVAGKEADSTDGTRPDTGATARRSPAPAPRSPPPVDSAFVAACNPPPPGAPAASLLLVTFSPTLTERERLEIAKRVGGTVAGVAASGERYVRMSPGGSTRTAADSLILYQGVTQVSERGCPAAAPSGR